MQSPSSNRIDQILASLDKAQRVPAPPYFYTRLRARLEQNPTIEKTIAWLRPIPVIAVMLVLLLLNFWLIKTPAISSSTSASVVVVEPEDELHTLALEDRTADHTITEFDLPNEPPSK
ncbi:MAG: hypothetical protein ACKO41_04750 [Sphingomonadales bacterium]